MVQLDQLILQSNYILGTSSLSCSVKTISTFLIVFIQNLTTFVECLYHFVLHVTVDICRSEKNVNLNRISVIQMDITDYFLWIFSCEIMPLIDTIWITNICFKRTSCLLGVKIIMEDGKIYLSVRYHYTVPPRSPF